LHTAAKIKIYLGEADSGVLQKVLQYLNCNTDFENSISVSIAIFFPPSVAIAIAIL